MFNRLMSALVLLSMFGCASVQAPPQADPNTIVVTRSAPWSFPESDGSQAIYTATSGGEDLGHVLIIGFDELYYHEWPSGDVAGDSVFTVTVHPDHSSLASFYERYPEGHILRPSFYVLGGGDNYLPMRANIDFDGPGLFIEQGREEASFVFSAPGGIQTQFVLSDGDFHGEDPGLCPSGDAFSATMVHERLGGYRVIVRFAGRSGFHSCRYTIDLVEEAEH